MGALPVSLQVLLIATLVIGLPMLACSIYGLSGLARKRARVVQYPGLIREKGWRGMLKGATIYLDPEARHYNACLKHELQHLRDKFVVGWLPWVIGYTCSKAFRRWAELRAYAVSYRHGDDLDAIARILVAEFGFRDKRTARAAVIEAAGR